MEQKKIKIQINEWSDECSEGCCHNWGTTLTVDDSEMIELSDSNASTMLREVLMGLGYEVEIIETYNGH